MTHVDPLTTSQRNTLANTFLGIRGRMATIWGILLNSIYEARLGKEHSLVTTGNPHNVTLEQLAGNVSVTYMGTIAAATGFPTAAAVRTGWFYEITTNVVDNNATKTNTGLTFTAGDRIVWNGSTWAVTGSSVSYVNKGNIANAAAFPTTAAVRTGYAYLVTTDVVDNDGTKTNTGLAFTAGDRIMWNGSTWIVTGSSVAYTNKGNIANAAAFPTTAVVRTGYSYLITADVADNDPTKTNTGLMFTTGDRIVWNGSTWIVTGSQFCFVEKGAIGAAADFPTTAAVRRGYVYAISADVTDNDGTKTNTGVVFAAGDRIVWNGSTWTIIGSSLSISGPFKYKGALTAAADFPTVAAVKPGWFYTVTTGCTDNDPTKTNTGIVFSARDEIVWGGATWVNFGTGRLHAGTHVTGGDDVIPNAVSGGNAGLQTGADKAAHDSLVLGGAGFWSDTADGAIGTRRFVEISHGGDLVAGSIDSDSVVGVGLNAAPVVGTDPITVGIGLRGLIAADTISAGDELKCAEDGMAICAITVMGGEAGKVIGGGAGLGYSNQPAGDQITIESSDALDVNVPIEVIMTTHGGLETVTEIKSTDGANGTTPVDSVKMNCGLLLAVKKPVTLGTITIKEKSGGLTICTLLAAATSSGVVIVPDGNQQCYNAPPRFAGDAGTTKTIGVKRIVTTGTSETYAAVVLNGTAAQSLASACRRVVELYVGDLEVARTLAASTSITVTQPEARCGRAYSAAANRGDTFTAVVR